MAKRKTYPRDGNSNGIAAKHIQLQRNIGLHWHDCCEMELVLAGRGTHTINGHTYPLQPGDLYLFTPADCHSITVEEPIELLGIMFDEKILTEETYSHILTLEMTGIDLLASLPQPQLEQASAYFSAILQEKQENRNLPFSAAYIEFLLNCITIILLRRIGHAPISAADKQPMAEAILYLHRHYTEPITLTSLAEHLHLTSSYLSTCFKTSVGRSFKDYLIELRLRYACRLLVNTNLSITDICFNCGFSSYSNFMRTFRAHYNTTPLLFRRQHQPDPAEQGTMKG